MSYHHQPAEPANKWTSAAAQAAEGNYHHNGPLTTGYRSWETVDEEAEDYDSTEWLDRKTKKVQNDSLMSTRRAVERLNESDIIARENMVKLSGQSEQLYKAEGRVESATSHVKVSSAKADHLKSLNRFFMMPSFGSGKAKKREALARKEAEERAANEDERLRGDRERSKRLGKMEQLQDHQSYRGSSKGTYTTAQDIERDEVEEEIDGNLDQLSSGLSRLKMIGQLMNEELSAQRGQVDRILDKSNVAQERLNVTTHKVQRLLD
ncbi:uncharacterized protein EV422DRAFT_559589 [Fimicolochytrium jonesii]|uniref:uncharacterized protein n=1 Tax=Fimicolochytrium jonesii TaxID=1396493 RepID=UPI0022FF3A8E|nr:uncharacterized protein EV422DRAFT_559589 [Fimicolochytrium jonesii]KAI8818622.1 hypothetical protein EV422DRAFT_559589 [Fimicolochytrium jonesii]